MALHGQHCTGKGTGLSWAHSQAGGSGIMALFAQGRDARGGIGSQCWLAPPHWGSWGSGGYSQLGLYPRDAPVKGESGKVL